MPDSKSVTEKLNQENKMRNITNKAVSAFFNDHKFKLGNTTVEHDGVTTTLKLHGSPIARKAVGPITKIEITTAGWNTLTTRARLNGLPGVSVCTKAGQLYLNGIVWSGDWKTIS